MSHYLFSILNLPNIAQLDFSDPIIVVPGITRCLFLNTPLLEAFLWRGGRLRSRSGEESMMVKNYKILACVCFVVWCAGLSGADQMASPVSTDVQKTQHFSKYMMKNSASVPVTVKVDARGDNLKTSQSMPHILVLPPRGSKEAFMASAKDPRSYYSTPDVSEDFKFGDYRITSSNMPLSLPWSKNSIEAVEAKDKKAIGFQFPKGAQVLCARAGLVVGVDEGSVFVAHNDGSVSRYTGLDSVQAKLGSQLAAAGPVGKAGEQQVEFALVTPDRNLKYRAIPALFTVNGSRTELSPGTKYTP
jgi:hypothetical protein